MNEELITPQLNEEQITQEAQTMAEPQEVYQPQDERYASVTSQVAKGVQKTGADFSAWANRKILSLKPTETPIKTVEQMVEAKAPLAVEAPEQQATKLFDKIENQQVPVFNKFNPRKEALDLMDSDIDEFDDALPYQINFNTIDNEDDVKAIIADMAEKNKTQIQQMRRGVVSDEQLYKLADDLGQDPKMIQDVLTRQAGGSIPPAEYIVAIRQALDQSAVKLKEYAKLVVENGSPTDKVNFSRQFDFHRKFQTSFMGIRAEYGRGLRAMGIPYDRNQEGVLEVMGAMEANLNVDTLANTILNARSTRGINQQVSGYGDIWKYGADAFYTNYVSSMLSGLSTQVLNIGGNVANLSTKLMDRKLAAWLPKGKNAPDEVQTDEITAQMIAYTSSFSDALSTAWKTLKTGEMYKGMDATGSRIDAPLPSEYFKLSGIGGSLLDGAFNFARFPIRNVMGSTDAFFKVISERGELASLAYRQAKTELDAGRIEPDMFKARLKDLMENPTDELKAKSTAFAREIAFQESPGETITKVNNAIQAVPGLRYIAPFVNTLSNITRQTLVERTPLAPLAKSWRDDFMAGGARRQLAESKVLMGTGILSMAYAMAQNDMLTPPMPNDKATRDLWKANGIKPLSVVFTNEDGQKVYVPHTGIEPFSTLFGVVASMHQFTNKLEFYDLTKDDEERFNSLYSDLLFAVSENTLNKTFATGIQTFFEAVNQGQKSFEKLTAMTTNTMIPYAGLRRNITKDMDEYKRSTDSVMEYIQSQIPLMSDELPQVLDIFGEPLKHDYTWLRWTPSYETKDPVRKELEALHTETKRMGGTDFRDKFGGLLAKPKDRAEWLQFARKEFTDAQGRNVHDILSDIIQSEGYKDMTSFEKVELIGSIFRRNDMAALQELSKNNPELYLKLHNTDVVKKAYYNLEKEGMTREDALQMAKEEIMGGF